MEKHLLAIRYCAYSDLADKMKHNGSRSDIIFSHREFSVFHVDAICLFENTILSQDDSASLFFLANETHFKQ